MVAHGRHLSGEKLHACIRYSWGLGDKVYAVVDAARARNLVLAARDEFGKTVEWLFEDNAGAQMSEVAPYVFEVAFRPKFSFPGSDFLGLWAESLGQHAGFLILTQVDLAALRDHLRDLFHVTDEDDHKYFFRYYDPRVLRTFLPTCTVGEAVEFFGPMRRILVEAREPGVMLGCSPGKIGVEINERLWDASATADARRGAQR